MEKDGLDYNSSRQYDFLNNNHIKSSLREDGFVKDNSKNTFRKKSSKEDNFREEGPDSRDENSPNEDFREEVSIEEDKRATGKSSGN